MNAWSYLAVLLPGPADRPSGLVSRSCPRCRQMAPQDAATRDDRRWCTVSEEARHIRVVESGNPPIPACWIRTAANACVVHPSIHQRESARNLTRNLATSMRQTSFRVAESWSGVPGLASLSGCKRRCEESLSGWADAKNPEQGKQGAGSLRLSGKLSAKWIRLLERCRAWPPPMQAPTAAHPVILPSPQLAARR